MNQTADFGVFQSRLDSFTPNSHQITRALALYASAIAFDNNSLLSKAVEVGLKYGCSSAQFYEVLLQSYLFLGFPRMLNAAAHLSDFLNLSREKIELAKISPDESAQWFERGNELCHRVYDSNFELLKDKVESFSPEIFRWMIIEGYGKVLSRTELDVVKREMAVVSSLTVENRPKQLFSHMKGALNIGADPGLLINVIEDIGMAAGEGYQAANKILERLKLK